MDFVVDSSATIRDRVSTACDFRRLAVDFGLSMASSSRKSPGLLLVTGFASIVFVRRSLLELGFFVTDVVVLLIRTGFDGDPGGVLENPKNNGDFASRSLGSTAAGLCSSGMSIWLICVIFKGVWVLFCVSI